MTTKSITKTRIEPDRDHAGTNMLHRALDVQGVTPFTSLEDLDAYSKQTAISLSFDQPNNLQVMVTNDARTVVVDIMESLRRDPCNIGHPIIARAVARYALAVRFSRQTAHSQKHRELVRDGLQKLTPDQQKAREPTKAHQLSKEQATANLSRVFEALVYDARPSLTEALMIIAGAVADNYPPTYFAELSDILSQPEIARIRRSDLRVERIERRLNELFSDADHSTVLRFLRDIFNHDCDLLLPKRSGGIAGAALQNTFVAWMAGSDPNTVKTYRSRRNTRTARSEASPTPITLAHAIEDIMLRISPIDSLPASAETIDLSDLCVQPLTR
jgi:hypothetical protein